MKDIFCDTRFVTCDETEYGALMKIYIAFGTKFLKIFDAISVKPENSFCVMLKKALGTNMSQY